MINRMKVLFIILTRNKSNIIKLEFNNIVESIRRMPISFVDIFDQKSYLFCNDDVKIAIESGEFKSALEHFILYGYCEVKKGQRQIGNEFPFMSEIEYMSVNQDVKKGVEEKYIISAFDHFIRFGYGEVGKYKRCVSGYFPFSISENEQQILKENFDENKYMEANHDIKAKIIKGKYKSPWAHFIECGIDEVRKGERILYKGLMPFNDVCYVKEHKDIYLALKNCHLNSPYKHYLLYGANEILRGTRSSSFSEAYYYVEPTINKRIRDEIANFNKKPLISIIVPVYNVDVKWLRLTIESIKKQWYENWELCIADDASTNKELVSFLKEIENPKIKITYIAKNVNISGASNAALKMAAGEYVALLDHDDELTPDALYESVKVINNYDVDLIYSDEDKIELSGKYVDPHFKADFSADLFLSQNYLSHLGVIKRALVNDVGGWTIGLEGAQDYDLYLKVLERTEKVFHIQKVLYHWRKIPGSTAVEFSEKSYAQEAGRKSLENAVQRRGINAIVRNGLTPGTYKVQYELLKTPLISIVIPFKNKPELLEACINSILTLSTYTNFEIIGISNNSTEDEVFTLMDSLKGQNERVSFYEFNEPFNYSQINNYAVKQYAKGEHVVFLNNDVEIITPEWLEELLSFSQRNDIGAVGAKLYYGNNTIQHAGIIIAPMTSHTVITPFIHQDKESFGYFSRLKCINNYNAVTAALMMVKKKIFLELGGFDEKLFPIAYNDVDLCLSLREKGYQNIFTPYVEAYHYESASRGADNLSIEKIERMRKEACLLKDKHRSLFNSTDEYYNKNLTIDKDDFSLSQSYDSGGEAFTDVILKNISLRRKKKKRVCVFSHFDMNNRIEDYVLYYLKDLSKIMDVVFVSTTAGLIEEELEKVYPMCMRCIVKENVGYDFGAWKTGLNSLGEDLDEYDWLYLCNDSIYGPLNDFNATIIDMEGEGFDIWSLTDSHELDYHLQSFFVGYSRKAVQNATFKVFWDNFEIYINKSLLIKYCEILYSKALLNDKDLSIGVFFTSKELSYLNMMHYKWDYLINHGFPFIKIELLRVNPMNLAISNWENVVKSNSTYPVQLITKHLDNTKLT